MKRSRRRPRGTTTLISGDDGLDAPQGWSEVEGRLMREFTFENFAAAKTFIDSVSEICERINHHAELHFGWGYAVVETMTHDTNSITDLDFQLALEINRLEVP